MSSYSLKSQRKLYYETLSNDGVLKWQIKSYKHFDQLGAIGKIPLTVWNKGLFRFLFSLLLPLVALCLDFYSLLGYIVKFFKPKKKIEFKRIFICKERHLYLIAKKHNMLTDHDVWFSSPFDTFTLPYEAKQVSISDYENISDPFRCFLQTLIIHFNVIFHFGYNYYLLSFKAFDWCMLDLALRRLSIDVDLYFCNFSDRVSIILDTLPQKNKILIQHGTMHFYNNSNSSPFLTWQEDKGFWIWNSLSKISPSKVYCFTENDEIALSRSVIANNPQYIHMGYDFKPAFKPDKFSVLIIANYTLFEKQEETIISQLQDLDINIYLKNHPQIFDKRYDEMRNKYNFIFLKGVSSELPDVDVVISYDSTLALEYESVGAEILYYGHFDINNVKEIVSQKLSQNKQRNDKS